MNVMTSAESLFAAVSKLNRVRVESSKNTLAIVFASKCWNFGKRPRVDLCHMVVNIEDSKNLFDAEVMGRQQMLH
jgi:hypothetical protein